MGIALQFLCKDKTQRNLSGQSGVGKSSLIWAPILPDIRHYDLVKLSQKNEKKVHTTNHSSSIPTLPKAEILFDFSGEYVNLVYGISLRKELSEWFYRNFNHIWAFRIP